MTKIKLTDIYSVVKSDDLNWTLTELKETKKGDVKEKNVFYYPSLLASLTDAVKIIADEKDARTVKGYIDNLKEAQTVIMVALKAAIKA